MIAGLIEGRIVHFVPPLGQGFRPGRHIPAMLVRVHDAATGLVNLRLLLDGTDDHAGYATEQGRTLVEWQQQVEHDPTGQKPGSWHFLERA